MVRPILSDRCLCLSVLFVLSVALVYCGQTVRWIKMKLGMKVGLDPGHIFSDGDPASSKGHSPNFRPISIVAKRSPISATAEHLLFGFLIILFLFFGPVC